MMAEKIEPKKNVTTLVKEPKENKMALSEPKANKTTLAAPNKTTLATPLKNLTAEPKLSQKMPA